MAIELLVIIGIFVVGMIISHLASGTAMKNLEKESRDKEN
jgi:uncharacterized integral membrane protein